MDSLLFWADIPALYRCVVFGTLALLITQTVFLAYTHTQNNHPLAQTKRNYFLHSQWGFLLLIGLFVFTSRWPGLFYPHGFNPDEDQFVAAARALVADPLFFRSTETASSGPLNIYPLWLAGLSGELPTLFSGRLIGLFMIWISLTGLYFSGKAFTSEISARIGTLTIVTFWGFTNFWDFVHYTSEHPPVMLLSTAWAFAAWAIFQSHQTISKRMGQAICSIMILSVVPFAKLQATPLAFLSSGLLLIGIGSLAGSLFDRCKRILIVGATGVILPLFIMGIFWWNDVFLYFWNSYILNAIAYKTEGSSEPFWKTLFMILFADGAMRPIDFLLLLGSCIVFSLLLIILLAVKIYETISKRQYFAFAFTCLLLAGAIWTVISPQRNYPHYLLFLLIPVGLTLQSMLGVIENIKIIQRHPLWTTCISLLILLSPMIFWRIEISPNHWAGSTKNWHRQPPNKIAKKILEAADGGNNRLCVWGYTPTYYTQTGLIQATRLSVSSPQFNNNELQNFFRTTYLEDLNQTQPSVFVDAVAIDQSLVMTEKEKHGHEQIPEIKDFVQTNYTLFAEIDGIRIYRRK